MEVQLSSLQKEYDSLENALKEYSTNEKCLKERICGLESEKEDLIKSLAAENEKVQILELDIEELKVKGLLLEEELSLKTLELKENSQLRPSLAGYQKKIQELEGGIFSTKSENVLLRTQLRNAVSNQELCERKLNHLESGRRALSFLTSEADKSVVDLKENILALQSILSSDDQNLEHCVDAACFRSYCEIPNEEEENLFTNLYSQIQSVKETISCVFLNEPRNIVTVEQDYDTKMWLSDISQCLTMLEDVVLSKFEQCKLSYAHSLLPEKKLRALMKTALVFKRTFLQVQKFKALVNLISSISKVDFTTNPCIAAFVDRSEISGKKLLIQNNSQVNNLETFLQICKTNIKPIMQHATKKLLTYTNSMKKHCLLMEDYQNIVIENHNLPAAQSTEYILYLHKIGSMCTKHSFTLSPVCERRMSYVWSHRDELRVKEALQLLEPQDISLVLNFYINLTDCIRNNFTGSPNVAFDAAITECSKSQIIRQSPVLISHMFNQTKKLSVFEELCQWEQFANIFSLDELSRQLGIAHLKNNFLQLRNERLQNKPPSKESSPKKREDVEEMCQDCITLLEEVEALELAIKNERDKQHMLNSTIEAIEQDLSTTFMQKEKLQNIVLEISRMFSYLKSLPVQTKSFKELEFNYECDSEICLCEICIKQEDSEVQHDSDKKMVSFETFTQWVKNIINKGCASLSDAEKKCEAAFALVDEKSATISQLEAEKVEFNVFFEQCQEKLKGCEEQLSKLSVDKDTFRQEVISKEECIKTLEKTIDDQNRVLEAQCKDYEIRIDKLKSTISEMKEQVGECREKDWLVSDLKNKIDSLQKANDSLNLNIKNIEKELQNSCTEKLSLEEKINMLTQETANLSKDVLTWTEMYELEKKSTSELTSKIQELNLNKMESDKEAKHFKTLYDGLESDVTILKNLQRDHEDILLAKNHSLEEKDYVIQQLKTKIEENNSQAENKFKFLEESELLLKSELEKANNQISELEKEIKRLQSIEEEIVSSKNQLNAIELQKEELLKDICSYKLTVEKLSREFELQKSISNDLNSKLANTQTALDKETELRIAVEKEINAKEESIRNLTASLKRQAAETSAMMYLKEEKERLKEREGQAERKVIDLKKELNFTKCTLTTIETKCSALSDENKILQEKLNSVSNSSTCKEDERSISKAEDFIKSFLDLMSEVVRECSRSPKLLSDLGLLQVQLNQSTIRPIEREVEFPPEILNNLKLVLKSNLRNSDEELKIVSLINSIGDSVNHIKEFTDSLCNAGELIKSGSPRTFDFGDNTINMTLNETCFPGSIGSKNTLSQITQELQQKQGLLQECFSVLQTLICKQTEQLKDLNFKLKQVSSRVSSSDPKQADKDLIKKCKFLKMTCQRWEGEANKFKGLYSEQKEKIKELEEKLNQETRLLNKKFEALNKEKVRIEEELQKKIKELEEQNAALDAEAEEYAEDYKRLEQQRSEDADALLEYETLKYKLLCSEEKNKKLKSVLEKYRAQPRGDGGTSGGTS